MSAPGESEAERVLHRWIRDHRIAAGGGSWASLWHISRGTFRPSAAEVAVVVGAWPEAAAPLLNATPPGDHDLLGRLIPPIRALLDLDDSPATASRIWWRLVERIEGVLGSDRLRDEVARLLVRTTPALSPSVVEEYDHLIPLLRLVAVAEPAAAAALLVEVGRKVPHWPRLMPELEVLESRIRGWPAALRARLLAGAAEEVREWGVRLHGGREGRGR